MRRHLGQDDIHLIHAYLERRLALATLPAPRLPRPAQTIAGLVLIGLLAVAILWCACDLLVKGG
jgi:hypothetical protein